MGVLVLIPYGNEYEYKHSDLVERRQSSCLIVLEICSKLGCNGSGRHCEGLATQSQHDRIAVEVRPADGETETLQRSKRWKFCIKRVIANVTKKWRPRVGNSLMSAKHRNASVLQAPEGISPKAPTRSFCVRLQ